MDPYARKAVVLGPKNFCILFDADGNPRIVKGPARVFPTTSMCTSCPAGTATRTS